MTWNTKISIVNDPVPTTDYADVMIDIRIDRETETVNVRARSGFDSNEDGFRALSECLDSVAELADTALELTDPAVRVLMEAGLSPEAAKASADKVMALASSGVGPVEEPRWAPTVWQQEQIDNMVEHEGASPEGAARYVEAAEIARLYRARQAAKERHPAGKHFNPQPVVEKPSES